MPNMCCKASSSYIIYTSDQPLFIFLFQTMTTQFSAILILFCAETKVKIASVIESEGHSIVISCNRNGLIININKNSTIQNLRSMVTVVLAV